MKQGTHIRYCLKNKKQTNKEQNQSKLLLLFALMLFFLLLCLSNTFMLREGILFYFLAFLVILVWFYLFWFWLSRGHGLVANKIHRLLLPVSTISLVVDAERIRLAKLEFWRLWCNSFGTRTSSCWPKRQWFLDLHPFCIFVTFVNMNFLNCCKDGFFCKMFSTFTFNPSLCIF